MMGVWRGADWGVWPVAHGGPWVPYIVGAFHAVCPWTVSLADPWAGPTDAHNCPSWNAHKMRTGVSPKLTVRSSEIDSPSFQGFNIARRRTTHFSQPGMTFE